MQALKSVTTSDKLHAISAFHPNLGTYGETNEDKINIKLENIPSYLFQILSYSPSHSHRAYFNKIHLLEDSQVCVTLPTFWPLTHHKIAQHIGQSRLQFWIQQRSYCEGIKRNCNLNVESRELIWFKHWRYVELLDGFYTTVICFWQASMQFFMVVNEPKSDQLECTEKNLYRLCRF